MGVDVRTRKLLGPLFTQLIRGEISDVSFAKGLEQVYRKTTIKDAAVEKAIFWADCLCCSNDTVTYAGDCALYPEVRERLERLAGYLNGLDEFDAPTFSEELTSVIVALNQANERESSSVFTMLRGWLDWLIAHAFPNRGNK